MAKKYFLHNHRFVTSSLFLLRHKPFYLFLVFSAATTNFTNSLSYYLWLGTTTMHIPLNSNAWTVNTIFWFKTYFVSISSIMTTQRVASWWENSPHCSYAYNYKDLSEGVYQPGGTAIVSQSFQSHSLTQRALEDGQVRFRMGNTIWKLEYNSSLQQLGICTTPSILSHTKIQNVHKSSSSHTYINLYQID